MRKGFWNGVVAGGLIGAVTAMIVRPQKKRAPKKGVLGKLNKVQTKAGRVAREVQSSYQSIKKIID